MVSRADGLGVNMVKEMVHSQIILSTEINPVVKIRAKKLNISVIQGADDKNIVQFTLLIKEKEHIKQKEIIKAEKHAELLLHLQ